MNCLWVNYSVTLATGIIPLFCTHTNRDEICYLLEKYIGSYDHLLLLHPLALPFVKTISKLLLPRLAAVPAFSYFCLQVTWVMAFHSIFVHILQEKCIRSFHKRLRHKASFPPFTQNSMKKMTMLKKWVMLLIYRINKQA